MKIDRERSVVLEDLVERLEHEVLGDLALELQLDLQAVLLHLEPAVRTLLQLPLQHIDNLVLVLLVDALEVLLVVDQVLLVDYAAADPQDRLQPREALLEQSLHGCRGDLSVEEGSAFPGEGDALLAAGPVLFEQEDDGLEDAAVEDGHGLSGDECLVTFLGLGVVVLATEVVLPLDEGLVGDQRIVLVVGDLEVPEEAQVLERREALVLVELDHDLVDEAVAGEEEEEGLAVGQDVLAVEG